MNACKTKHNQNKLESFPDEPGTEVCSCNVTICSQCFPTLGIICEATSCHCRHNRFTLGHHIRWSFFTGFELQPCIFFLRVFCVSETNETGDFFVVLHWELGMLRKLISGLFKHHRVVTWSAYLQVLTTPVLSPHERWAKGNVRHFSWTNDVIKSEVSSVWDMIQQVVFTHEARIAVHRLPNTLHVLVSPDLSRHRRGVSVLPFWCEIIVRFRFGQSERFASPPLIEKTIPIHHQSYPRPFATPGSEMENHPVVEISSWFLRHKISFLATTHMCTAFVAMGEQRWISRSKNTILCDSWPRNKNKLLFCDFEAEGSGFISLCNHLETTTRLFSAHMLFIATTLDESLNFVFPLLLALFVGLLMCILHLCIFPSGQGFSLKQNFETRTTLAHGIPAILMPTVFLCKKYGVLCTYISAEGINHVVVFSLAVNFLFFFAEHQLLLCAFLQQGTADDQQCSHREHFQFSNSHFEHCIRNAILCLHPWRSPRWVVKMLLCLVTTQSDPVPFFCHPRVSSDLWKPSPKSSTSCLSFWSDWAP